VYEFTNLDNNEKWACKLIVKSNITSANIK
jgi:hypothetical protein